MLNLKKFSKRTIRRDRNDDLSMITGGRPSISLGGPRSGLKYRVNHDLKLQQHFINARAKAIVLNNKSKRPPKSHVLLAPCPYKLSLFNNTSSSLKDNDPKSSLILPVPPTPHPQQHGNIMEPPRQQSSGCTLNSIPSLVKTSQSRQAVLEGKPRGILKPSSGNSLYGASSQTQYWSHYANTGGVSKPRISSTIYNMGNKRSQNRPTSSYKLCSTAPINREDASLLQMEMISTMSGRPSGASQYFSTTPGPPLGPNNLFGRFSTPRPVHVIPSLVRSVQLPAPSPIFPVPGASPALWGTPTSGALAGPPNGCGVHQGEWMDRSKCLSKAPTKQYSMEQIIDILCGFATPDSIMADQLFKPHPTPTQPNVTPLKNSENRLNAAPTISNEPWNNHWNVSSHSHPNNKRKENPATRIDDDDGETSVYFRSEKTTSAVTKKKQVSFLTDSDGKLCVNEFLFNPFSQEFMSSGSAKKSTEKENLDPNFESVLPPAPINIFSNEQSNTVNPSIMTQHEEQTFNQLPQFQCDETTSPYFNAILPTHNMTPSAQPDLNQRLNNESSSAPAYLCNLSSEPTNQPFNPFEDHFVEPSNGSRKQGENVESNLESQVLSFPSPALHEAQAFINDLQLTFNSQLPEIQGQLFTQDFLNSYASNPEDKSMDTNLLPVNQAGEEATNLLGNSEISVNNSFNVSETIQQILNSETFLF